MTLFLVALVAFMAGACVGAVVLLFLIYVAGRAIRREVISRAIDRQAAATTARPRTTRVTPEDVLSGRVAPGSDRPT